jgi:hypothetical protein
MKKAILIICLSIPFCLMAQVKVEPGWFIIQKNATYATIFPSSNDLKGNSEGVVDISSFKMMAGETVLVFGYSQGRYLTFDPMGRFVAFNGYQSLQRAPVNDVSSVGIMIEDIELLNGSDIKKGMYVWVTAQDVAHNTITITQSGGKTIDIPKSSINILSKFLQGFIDQGIYETVTQ